LCRVEFVEFLRIIPRNVIEENVSRGDRWVCCTVSVVKQCKGNFANRLIALHNENIVPFPNLFSLFPKGF